MGSSHGIGQSQDALLFLTGGKVLDVCDVRKYLVGNANPIVAQAECILGVFSSDLFVAGNKRI